MGQRDWSNIAGADQGAGNALYTALSPELKGMSGRYIYLESEDPNISDLARFEQLAERLWNKSLGYISNWLSVGSE